MIFRSKIYIECFFVQLLFIIPLTIFSGECFAQQLSNGYTSDFQYAKKLFLDKNFEDALPVFERLLETFPKDPYYQYYTGVCQVELNADIEKAVDNLFQASIKNVPANVYYYLGNAYALNYQFYKAVQSFQKYLVYESKDKIEEKKIKLKMSWAESAKQAVKISPSPQIISKTPYLANKIEGFYNTLELGDFIRTPVMINADASETTEKLVMHLPSSGNAFVSGMTKNSKTRKDLFKLEKRENEEWSSPIKMEFSANTEFNEVFPFYDPATKSLYFSHDGIKSMGGLDIFVTRFDDVLQKWSAPENLGFPINSPADEYLFVVKGETAYFATTRFDKGDTVTVVQIRFPVQGKNKALNELNQIQEAAILDLKAESEKENAVEKKISTKTKKTLKKVPGTYPEMISFALQSQFVADSLLLQADELRTIRSNTTNVAARRTMYSQIQDLKKEALENQVQADQWYLKAREKELQEGAFPRKRIAQSNLDGLLKKENDDDNDKGADKTAKTAKEEPEKVNPYSKLLNQFRIYEKTQYSDENPIPLKVETGASIVYKIQLGAFSKPVVWDQFGGLSPLTGEYLEDRGITKYYAGLFTSINACRNALEKVRDYGYKDAYIVSYFDGKKVSISRAVEIEKTLEERIK